MILKSISTSKRNDIKMEFVNIIEFSIEKEFGIEKEFDIKKEFDI